MGKQKMRIALFVFFTSNLVGIHAGRRDRKLGDIDGDGHDDDAPLFSDLPHLSGDFFANAQISEGTNLDNNKDVYEIEISADTLPGWSHTFDQTHVIVLETARDRNSGDIRVYIEYKDNTGGKIYKAHRKDPFLNNRPQKPDVHDLAHMVDAYRIRINGGSTGSLDDWKENWMMTTWYVRDDYEGRWSTTYNGIKGIGCQEAGVADTCFSMGTECSTTVPCNKKLDKILIQVDKQAADLANLKFVRLGYQRYGTEIAGEGHNEVKILSYASAEQWPVAIDTRNEDRLVQTFPVPQVLQDATSANYRTDESTISTSAQFSESQENIGWELSVSGDTLEMDVTYVPLSLTDTIYNIKDEEGALGADQELKRGTNTIVITNAQSVVFKSGDSRFTSLRVDGTELGSANAAVASVAD